MHARKYILISFPDGLRYERRSCVIGLTKLLRWRNDTVKYVQYVVEMRRLLAFQSEYHTVPYLLWYPQNWNKDVRAGQIVKNELNSDCRAPCGWSVKLWRVRARWHLPWVRRMKRQRPATSKVELRVTVILLLHLRTVPCIVQCRVCSVR